MGGVGGWVGPHAVGPRLEEEGRGSRGGGGGGREAIALCVCVRSQNDGHKWGSVRRKTNGQPASLIFASAEGFANDQNLPKKCQRQKRYFPAGQKVRSWQEKHCRKQFPVVFGFLPAANERRRRRRRRDRGGGRIIIAEDKRKRYTANALLCAL